MRKRRRLYFQIALTSTLWLATAIGSVAAERSPFFAMDTALRDGQTRSAADQAALLKQLGFDGFGASGYLTDEFLVAFKRAGLRVFNTYITLDFDSSEPELDEKLKELVPRLKGHDTDLWIAINGVTRNGVKLTPSDPSGDAVIVRPMRQLADLAQSNGIRIAFAAVSISTRIASSRRRWKGGPSGQGVRVQRSLGVRQSQGDRHQIRSSGPTVDPV